MHFTRQYSLPVVLITCSRDELLWGVEEAAVYKRRTNKFTIQIHTHVHVSNVRIYVYMHRHTCMHTHAHKHTFIHVQTHTHIHTCTIHIHTHTVPYCNNLPNRPSSFFCPCTCSCAICACSIASRNTFQVESL